MQPKRFFSGLLWAGLLAMALPALLRAAAPKPVDPGAPAAKEPAMIEDLKLVAKAISVIQDAFVNDVDRRNLVYDAVKGMLAGLGDRYTEFIDPKRYELLKIQMRGEYAGIGVMLQIVKNFPMIKGVKPGSSAQKAGLKPGDLILKVNGESVENLPLPDVAPRLRGEAGTRLVLTLQRPPRGQIVEVEVVRETIQIEAVRDVRMVGKSLGYFWLNEWEEKTMEQVDKALEDLKAQGMQALIIDLRGNDGGLLPVAVALSERFLKKGDKIVSVNSKIAEQRKDYFSSGEHTRAGIELVVLVNGKSASASEIFSVAMQDHKRAAIVGEQTYGKASVQSVVPLDDKSAMKMTTARYRSPLGRSIDQVGLTPDFVIVNETPGQGPDPQLMKAMDLLKKYL